MEELVINPDEKAIEAGQHWQQQADAASYEPPKLADIASQGRLYLLAEGVGGSAGDAAARYAVQKTLHAYFTSLLTNPRERLLAAARQSNREIFERNQLHPTRRPLAATFTAALIHNSRLLVANSGDNRAYVVWDQDIEQLTANNANPEKTDDSPVRVIEPTSSEPPTAKPAPSSFSTQLPRGLGLEPDPPIEIFARRLFAGDVVVLVSGSLTGYIEPKEIARAVNLHPPEPAIRRLIALAAERGHRDRCAISIIRVTSDPIAKRLPRPADLPVAPTWAEVNQSRPPASKSKEADTDTRPMSAGAPVEPSADKPKFTRPPNFMPDASRRQLNPRLMAVLAIVVALLLCSGLFVAARALLPADMLASLPMASSLGLVDAPAGDEPQVVRLPSPTPLTTPTSTGSPMAETSASNGSSPLATPTTAAQSGSSFSSPVGTPDSSAADTVTQPATPSPTPSPQPTIELPAGCENRGRFVDDVTIPDGTQLAPGEQFEKAWRVNNADTCPWGPGYTVRFLEGEQMGAADTLPLTIIVPPEEDGEIRVSLTAPTQPGEYESTWQLHDLSGQPFGPKLFLDIVVTPAVLAQGDAAQMNTLFDFVANADEAAWTSGDSTYSVLRSPISDTMELPRPEGLVAVGPAQLRGNLESQADALLTYPHLENGFIEGRYRIDTPLQPTDTFAAEIGFTKLSILSDDGVTFEVTFTPDVGEEVTLFSSLVEYGDSPVTQIVPLDEIAPDSTGEVTLRVLGGDSLSQDWALWINARLVRP